MVTDKNEDPGHDKDLLEELPTVDPDAEDNDDDPQWIRGWSVGYEAGKSYGRFAADLRHKAYWPKVVRNGIRALFAAFLITRAELFLPTFATSSICAVVLGAIAINCAIGDSEL